MSDRGFFVLSGPPEAERSLLDAYHHDGRYRGTLTLPEAVNFISALEAHAFAAVIFEPIPHIKTWQWTPR